MMPVLQTLLQNDAIVNVFDDLERENALCSAVRDGEFDEVARMLSEQYDPNSGSDYDLRYMTALERAVDELHINLVALLFVHGADPANNVYQGEEPNMASYSGHAPMDVRSGFEEAFNNDNPIAGFPGLHALLRANSEERGCKRMRSILFLMEGCMTHEWENKMFRHLRIGFGASATSRARDRLKCVLLCLKRALSTLLPHYFTNEIMKFVMLEEVNLAFWALAQTNAGNDDEPSDEDSENCQHDNTGRHVAFNSCVVGGTHGSHEETVVQDVQHDDRAAVIHPVEAAQVTAEMEAGFVERLAALRLDGYGENYHDIPGNAQDAGVSDPQMDANLPFSRLVMLNFTRHPPSFEAALTYDEGLRETREALKRAGLDLRLQNGAFVFVSPDEYPVAKLAVSGKTLTASHVVVSEMLEPVVRAAVNSATSHRDNVRVREKHDLGYAGEDPVIVEHTFLSIPRALRRPESVTNSTTAAHEGTNPRRFTLGLEDRQAATSQSVCCEPMALGTKS